MRFVSKRIEGTGVVGGYEDGGGRGMGWWGWGWCWGGGGMVMVMVFENGAVVGLAGCYWRGLGLYPKLCATMSVISARLEKCRWLEVVRCAQRARVRSFRGVREMRDGGCL